MGMTPPYIIGSGGGGIYNAGTMDITNSRFDHDDGA